MELTAVCVSSLLSISRLFAELATTRGAAGRTSAAACGRGHTYGRVRTCVAVRVTIQGVTSDGMSFVSLLLSLEEWSIEATPCAYTELNRGAESDVLIRESIRILHNPARGSMCVPVFIQKPSFLMHAILSTSPYIEL
jgi:hypothetical protein